ncbi:Os08g0112950 [Oryza sativa Japonica Group]|uniref:Os08g0112950 protein n=1 Tax=Oryza sativa subsp. japonica TaxID=39947 RepID=A0A0P0XB33_ORYSJ|nr:hypothetical protein EE612_041749 [Oryza sativa]BAT03523.1 Os08g0112950 [Oryza sativa Japonica Group]
MMTASRAARARTSAQETTPGHRDSRASLMRSMTSKPRRLLLASASFSAVLSGVESRRTEASQPWTKQSWKWRRRRLAASDGSPISAWLTTLLTTISANGQLIP